MHKVTIEKVKKIRLENESMHKSEKRGSMFVIKTADLRLRDIDDVKWLKY